MQDGNTCMVLQATAMVTHSPCCAVLQGRSSTTTRLQQPAVLSATLDCLCMPARQELPSPHGLCSQTVERRCKHTNDCCEPTGPAMPACLSLRPSRCRPPKHTAAE